MGNSATQRDLRAPTDVLRATEDQLLSERCKSDFRPRVLVLLAAYNGEQWIGEQLQSILDQEGVDVHVVIRDDCSTDTTIEMARNLSERLTVTSASKPSGSASQNFFSLIREHSAQGFDFVAFSDQDDSWNADKLARACSQLATSARSGYSSSVIAVWEQGEERVLRQSRKARRFDFLFEGAGQGCTFVLTSGFYERARAFLCSNERLTRNIQFHDWTMYALARSWDLGWCFDSQPTMRYRQHGSNTIGAKKSIEGIRRRIALIRSGWYKTQLGSMAQLCVAAAPSRTELWEWQRRLNTPDTFFRRLHLAWFCLLHGRRNTNERAVLLLSALRGWI